MRRILAALLAGLALEASAAEPARWYLQVDNDAILDTDRWYSSGLRVARVADHGAWKLELGILQEIYTPEGERFVFGTVDRAPTARLLFTAARHDRTPELWQTIGLDVGVRGPAALGEEVTDFIHRFVSASEIAWGRQESNRLDAQLTAVRTHHFPWSDVHYGAVLGNEVTFVHAGAELRFGARGASSPVLRHAATPPWMLPGNAGWGGFVGANVRAVLRNEMLKRPYAVFGEELERKKAVARAIAGVTWSGGGFGTTAALAYETREFEGQRAAHQFVSITLHAGF